MEMEIGIRPMDSQSLHYVDQFDRTSTVNEKLVLHLEENRLSYSIVSVLPYKKDLSVDAEDYTTFIGNPQKVIFFAYVDDKPVGQIKVVPWWNKLAYIEELTVDPSFRGHGVGRALLARAIEAVLTRVYTKEKIQIQTRSPCIGTCSFSNLEIYAQNSKPLC